MDDLEFNSGENKNVPDNNTLKEVHKWYILRIAVLIILNTTLFLLIVKPFPDMVQTILVSNLVSFNIAGLIIGTIVAGLPYKSLPYSKRYLRASLLSILVMQSLMTTGLTVRAAFPSMKWYSSNNEVESHHPTEADFPMIQWPDSHFDLSDFEHIYFGEIDSLKNYTIFGLNNILEDSMPMMLIVQNELGQLGFGGKVIKSDSCRCYLAPRGNSILLKFIPLNDALDSFTFTFHRVGESTELEDREFDPYGPMILRKYIPKELPNTQPASNIPIQK